MPRSARSYSWSLSGSSSARALAFAVGEPAAHTRKLRNLKRGQRFIGAPARLRADRRRSGCGRPRALVPADATARHEQNTLASGMGLCCTAQAPSQRGGTMSEPSDGARRERDKPWIFRTYAGHSTAHDSNALYRKNLAKGQTGLSVAFDLPTQTGYDSDHALAKGEVGKVGVP